MSVGMRRNRPARPGRAGSGPWSIRAHLLWIWVGAVAAVVIATGYGFVWSSDQAGRDAVERMTFRADKAATSISKSVTEATTAVETIITTPGMEQVFSQPDTCALAGAGSGAFTDIRLDLVRPDGSVACSSNVSDVEQSPGAHGEAAWLDEALGSAEPAVTWDGTDPVTGESAVIIAAPVVGADARPAGAAGTFLHLLASATELSADLQTNDRATVTILDESGRVVSISPLGSAPPAAIAGDEFDSSQGLWVGLDGTERYFGSSEVAGSPWRIYVGTERPAVLADARGLLIRQGLIGLLALLLVAAATIVLDRRVAAPLRTVTAAVADAGRDPSGPHVKEVGTSELVSLVRRFNEMLDLRAGHDAQLRHVATHDPLTGLPNAVLLRDRLHNALRDDEAGSDLAVLCLGLDRFKNVNDGFGHDVGDRMLQDVAERIATQLRPGDTLARFGGDQFVIVCEATKADRAVEMVERLQDSLRHPFAAGGSDIVLQASIGIAIGEPNTGDAERLLREASSAMQQAKDTGSGWMLFAGESQARAARHLAVEHALREALRRHELVVHYQPMLDLASGRIVGAEALVRWQHPTRGILQPVDFIPVAEQTGQIGAIGAFVLAQACHQGTTWSETGHPLRVSVNVAAGQLQDAEFPTLVKGALADSGLPAGQLCLEITESSLVRQDDPAVGNLTQLRTLGVHVAVDDFGTGFSSLAYLHHMPVDELKVDRSFIARLGPDARDSHLVEAIIRMAQALGLGVVAEGVETSDQLATLTDLRCQRAQGFLFAEPQSVQDFGKLLAAGALAGPLPAA